MRLGGWGSATLIIFATTVDDTVWLSPFIISCSLTLKEKFLHGLLFIVTLQVLTFICVLLASGIRYSLPIFGYDDDEVGKDKQEHTLSLISAIICWVIASVLYFKALLKRRRKQEKKTMTLSIHPTEEEISLSSNQRMPGYTTISKTSIDHEDTPTSTMPSFSPWTVISLTTVGALDELSYFPSLLTGHLFSPQELFIGALLASLMILIIVSMLLSTCKPLLDFLDNIPLYMVVGFFATLLTIRIFL